MPSPINLDNDDESAHKVTLRSDHPLFPGENTYLFPTKDAADRFASAHRDRVTKIESPTA